MGRPPLSNCEEPMAHEKLSIEQAVGVPHNHIESHPKSGHVGPVAHLSFD